ncbi:MAG: hypothetical protein KC502_17685 [Myxococcales bacterium]|nr:hypothetical protein [Myxococcales bacterium]
MRSPKYQRSKPRSAAPILEVQAWDEKAGWHESGTRRSKPKVKSLVQIDAVTSSSQTTKVIVTLLVAAGLLVALI